MHEMVKNSAGGLQGHLGCQFSFNPPSPSHYMITSLNHFSTWNAGLLLKKQQNSNNNKNYKTNKNKTKASSSLDS